MNTRWNRKARAAVLSAGLCLLVLCVALAVQTQTARPDPWAVTNTPDMPRYKWDPTWPKPLPNKWKMGGITGLAVDKDDNVWILTRPNDTTPQEGNAGLNPPIADCCVRPPSMIHIDKNGNVIGSFDAQQGHGMDVDSQGFVYIGQNTVRKYDPRTGQVVKEVARVPEPQPQNNPQNAAAVAAFRAKYPPSTPMIVGGLEEIRLDEAAREMYVADNYLGGRILVFDLDTFAFKRGWGAYGKPLAQISTNEADHDYTPGGPMPKDFAGHLTLNFSNDGLVYAADRNANRIHVTDKQGRYQNKEFVIAPMTGEGGSTGGVAFSPDRQQRQLWISDLTNNTIWFLNREDGKILGRMGSMGENGGQFFGLHMIAVDSRGYIYTGEVFNGERAQRLVPENTRIDLNQLVAMAQPYIARDRWTAAPTPEMPRYRLDPDWPKTLPNKWKMGGVTGLAVDKDDNVWVHNRPNDTTDVEGHFGLNPPTADCCVRPPAMIHIDKNGTVIGSFDAPQGHGMDVDSQGFIYLGNTVQGQGSTVRKYDPKTGQMVKAVPRAPETQPQGGGGAAAAAGRGGAGRGGAGRGGAAAGGRGANQADPAAAVAAFRAKYPPSTPMIVGNVEEIRLDEPAREIYVADSYLGGRVLVFDFDTFAFKRGWGAYGKPLAEISTDDAARAYTPGGPMPRDFRGHLTLNFSSDGLVYAADRNANRIHVTDKQGKFLKEFTLATATGAGGSTGGVGFSADPQQRYLYISDLTNNTIWFLNREDGKLLGRMGSMGDNAGQFYGLHMIAVDSRGNIYTGEVQNGERVQRFVPAN